MLLTEYDYDTDIAVQRQEAYNEGIQLGRTEGIQLGLSRGISQGRSEGIQLGRTEGIQLGISQGRTEGISLGSQQKAIETAKNFLAMGLNIEQVVKGTGLPRETVDELSKTT